MKSKREDNFLRMSMSQVIPLSTQQTYRLFALAPGEESYENVRLPTAYRWLPTGSDYPSACDCVNCN